MSGPRVRRLFLGGNTTRGFVDFHQYVSGPQLDRIVVIKGGPGVGKSTLMRRFAEAAQERGHDVEMFYCSSDNGSLDAVTVPGLKVGLIDGTAPHVIDPCHPGAIDEIVNLGECWDEAGMRRHRDDVVRLFAAVGRLFGRLYACLRAAGEVKRQLSACPVEAGALDLGGLNEQSAAINADLLDGAVRGVRPVAPGRARHLFATAVTPDGLCGFLDDVAAPLSRRAVVVGPPGTGKSTLAARFAAAAQERGFDVEVFHCGFEPGDVEHVVVPERGVGLLTAAPPHHYQPRDGDAVIDTSRYLDPLALAPAAPEMERLTSLYQRAMDVALGFLARAKQAHDELETFYTPHMDFRAVERRGRALVERVLDAAHAAG